MILIKQYNLILILHLHMLIVVTPYSEWTSLIKHYQTSMKLSSWTPLCQMHFLGKANVLDSIGELENALKEFTNAIKLKPDFFEAYNNRGRVFAKLREFDNAIDNFTNAIRYKPNFAYAYYNRGVAFSEKGDNITAIPDFQKAIELEPKNGVFRSTLIRILKLMGRNQDAKKQEEIAREFIKNESEYNQACFESICGNFEKAIKLLEVGLTNHQATKVWARQDPDFENIRNDPRFIELVSE